MTKKYKMTLINMGEYMNFKKLPNWLAVIFTAIGMIVLTSVTLGGDSRQIQMNTDNLIRLESENKTDHKEISNKITDMAIDIAIIKEYVLSQKEKKQ